MAQCSVCKDETEIYEGGDVPVCVECLDRLKAKRKLPASEQPIHAALLQDFRDAAARSDEATREFQAVMGRLPSGLPQSQRIKNASCNLTIARNRMMTAHNRLNEYIARDLGG